MKIFIYGTRNYSFGSEYKSSGFQSRLTYNLLGSEQGVIGFCFCLVGGKCEKNYSNYDTRSRVVSLPVFCSRTKFCVVTLFCFTVRHILLSVK